MASISKRLVYETRDVIPTGFSILGDTYPVTLEGSTSAGALWNFAIVKKPNLPSELRGLVCSLAENHSNVGKGVRPIVGFSLHTMKENNLQFLKAIAESKLAQTGLKIDGIGLNSYSELSRPLQTNYQDSAPQNLISFSPDLERKLLYLPKPFSGLPSIFDRLDTFKTITFQDYLAPSQPIEVPKSGEYLVITPFATAPLPHYIFFDSVGTISISMVFNAELEVR